MSDQMEMVEITIDQARSMISKRDALFKLLKNANFKKIISDGYFQDEAAKLVMLKSEPAMDTPEMQTKVDNAIIGIGALQQYFIAIERAGDQAEKDLIGFEETREALAQEEV